jgi:aminoglycoside phosphotransferase (APT) family kinase protein
MPPAEDVTGGAAYAPARLVRAWPDVAHLLAEASFLDRLATSDLELEQLDRRGRSHEQTPSGRHTARMRLHDGSTVIVKTVPDDRGRLAHEVQCALWHQGFGRDSAFRVAEPIGYLEEHRLALMHEAAGRSFSDLLVDGDPDAVLEGARQAARWLARLHTTPVVLGVPLLPERAAHDLARAAAKLVAHDPAAEHVVVASIDALDARLPARPPAVVQCHLDYRPDHVLVAGDHVTVLDFNSTAPADPAWDLARFVMKTAAPRHRRAKAEPALAERAAAEFVAEYRRCRPSGLAGLPYALSYLTVRQLFRAVRRGEEAEAERWRRELAAVPERFATSPGEGPAG